MTHKYWSVRFLLVLVVIALLATTAWALYYDTIAATTLKVGKRTDNWSMFTVSGGATQCKQVATKAVTTATYTVVPGDFGKTLLFSYLGAVAVTLPANSAPAGSWFRCINIGSDATVPTYTVTPADTLITVNEPAGKSVTFGTGHRIGSCVTFVGTGLQWVAMNNSSGCTMTVTP